MYLGLSLEMFLDYWRGGAPTVVWIMICGWWRVRIMNGGWWGLGDVGGDFTTTFKQNKYFPRA